MVHLWVLGWVGVAEAAAPFVGGGVQGLLPLPEDFVAPSVVATGYLGATFPADGVELRGSVGSGFDEYRYIVESMRLDGVHLFRPEARVDPLLLYGIGMRSLTPWGAKAIEESLRLGVRADPLLITSIEAGGGCVFRVTGPLHVRADARIWVGTANVDFGPGAFVGLDASVTLELRPVSPDRDHDRIKNRDDVCPDVAEDADGLLDRDGCPEEDVDQDGVADGVDPCPTRRETRNGYQDADGCPDVPPPRAPAAVPEPLRAFSGTIDGLYFGFDSAEILPTSEAVLSAAANVLRDHPTVRVHVRGHTDAVADDAYNLTLSAARAQAVVVWLGAHGVDVARLSSEGVGEAEPVESNDTEEGRSHNRRVQFVILE